MNENKNKNRFNDMDSEDYRDKKYYLNQRNEIKKEKNLARKKRKLERQKKRYQKFQAFKKSINNFRLGTKSYMAELFHPNTLVGIVLAIVLIVDSRKIQQEVKNQAVKIDQIERVLESQTEKVSSTKEFINEHWPKIVSFVGPILTKIVIDYIKHSRTIAEKDQTIAEKDVALSNANQQVIATTQKLETSQVQLKDEKTRSEQALEQEKIESVRKVQLVEKEAVVKINKLKVTLNRFNTQALEYAKKELQMREQIVQSKNELADAITQRDVLSRQLAEDSSLIETKNHELSKSSLELKSLQQKLNEVEDSQANLLTQLRNSEQEKMSLKNLLFRTESKLQNTVNKKNKERLELLAQIGNQEKDIGTLKVEKEQISKNLESTIKDQKSLEEETEKLRTKNLKNEIDLQSSMDDTTRVVIKMDEMEKELETLRLRDKETSGENIHLRQKLDAERQVADQQEKQIFENENKNQKLETECNRLKTEHDEAIIREDDLKKQLELDKLKLEKLEHGSNEEKSQLEKVIKETQKKLKTVEREKQDLEKTSAKQGKQLAKQYLAQQELIDKHQKQLVTVYGFGTNYLSQLQRERLDLEQKFKTTTQENVELTNQLQQEKGIRWYQKIRFQFIPEVSINKNPEQEKQEKTKESYFYGGWSPEIPHGTIKVEEKFNPKTKQYEIVNPKRSKAIKIK